MPRKKSATKRAKETAKKVKIENPISFSAIYETKEKENTSESEELSSSSDEDDFGELVTQEVEDGIKSVLKAIKNDNKELLLNPKVKFFEDPEKVAEKLSKHEKYKPIYLKDYHRMNILSGDVLSGDDDSHNLIKTVDGKQSYVSQQIEEKAQLLDEIQSAFNMDNEENDEDFLRKKEDNTVQTRRNLPDPTRDDQKFLEEFLNQQAWIPKKGDKILNLDQTNMDECDEEFDDVAEKFENAYNFRYEDPNAAEIVSYARNQATLRRSENSSRRKKREEEKEMKEKSRKDREILIKKKKTEKVNHLKDILERVQKEYGAEVNESLVKKLSETLLKGDFEHDKWDQVIGEIFDDEFYKQDSKPTWDENDPIMEEFYNESGVESMETHHNVTESEDVHSKKTKRQKIDEKRSKKKEKRQLVEMIEDEVEKNKFSIMEEVDNERGRSKSVDGLKFRYREVSPDSFGLTTREIFAADDTDLNEFIGLKKFAPYRSKELTAKDKRKVMKNRRVREWRKKVFNDEQGLKEV